MSWTYDKTAKIWRCTRYTDLQYAEINNFAEYGQPYSPYQRGYDAKHVPDFSKIVIEIPQTEVMYSGYGAAIEPLDFPLVYRFLANGVLMGDTRYTPKFAELASDRAQTFVGTRPQLPIGQYVLSDLITRGLVTNRDRFISTNLYGWGSYGITAGGIAAGDAAYIHGTVSFALTRDTRFVVTSKQRRVEAEISAGDDNWDFNSSTILPIVNTTVAVIAGPDHYNLTDPITIIFRGAGKRMTVTQNL